MINKKRLSRLQIILLALICLTLSILSFSVFAEEDIPQPALSANDVQVTAGNYVDIYLQVENLVSVGALDLYAFYDPEVMTLTGSSKQTIANSAQVSINTGTLGEACFSAVSTDGMSGDGNIWCLNFKVNSNAEAGTYYINFAVGNAYDLLLEPVSISATSCAVTVNRANTTVTPQKVSVYASYTNQKYEQGDTFNVRFGTSSAKGMASAEFIITYDPYLLSPTSVNLDSKLTSTNGAIWSVNDKTPGYIKISYAALEGVIGSVNSLVDMNFEVIGSVSEDTVSSIGMELLHPYDSALNIMTGSSTTASISLTAPSEVIVLPEITLENAILSENTLRIEILASESTQIAAGDFVLTYDASLLECLSIECPTDGCMIIGNIKKSEGKVLFSFICEDGISADTILSSVTFQIVCCTDISPAFSITGKNLVTSAFKSIDVVYQSKLPKIDLSHQLVSFKAQDPTCVSEGWAAYVACERCAYSTFNPIPSTGHSPGVKEDCLNDQLCTTCFEVLTPKLGHNHSTEWTVDVEPTCTEVGSKSHHCSRCSDKADITEIPATGHSYGEWTQTLAPACTVEGSERRDCEACDHYETQAIDALGHNYSTEWTVDVEPTCTEVGSKSHHCSRCSDKADVTEISATGHSYGEWTQTLAPTCTVEGIKRRDCANCDHYENQAIDALGHNYSTQWTVDVKPTCTEVGSKSHHCSRCSDKADITEISATGHSYGTWIAATAPSCEMNGTLAHYECSLCHKFFDTNKIEMSTIVNPATSHDYDSVVIVSTCTEQGYTNHTCANCQDSYMDTYVDAVGHEFENDQDTICDRCGYKRSVAIEQPDENPDKPLEKDRLSTGAIVGTIVGGIAVVGIGGFLIFWLVVKKKKLFDLLMMFKK